MIWHTLIFLLYSTPWHMHVCVYTMLVIIYYCLLDNSTQYIRERERKGTFWLWVYIYMYFSLNVRNVSCYRYPLKIFKDGKALLQKWAFDNILLCSFWEIKANIKSLNYFLLIQWLCSWFNNIPYLVRHCRLHFFHFTLNGW